MFSGKNALLYPLILGYLSIAMGGLGDSFVRAQEITPIKSFSDFCNFLYMYCEKPEPERISSLIDWLNADGCLSRNPEWAPSLFVFFSQVAAANPKLVPEWKKRIEKGDPATRNALERALTIKVEDVLKETPVGPNHINILWSAYSATGDEVWVRQIIGTMKDLPERKDRGLYVRAGYARMSLNCYANEFPRIKQILEKARKETKENLLRVALDETLTKTHDELCHEFYQILFEQKDKGVWK